MSKFTPGPWRVPRFNDGCAVVASKKHKGHRITITYQAGDSVSEDEQRANARLIAAAPDMLETLSSIKGMIENCAGAPTDPSSLPQMVLALATKTLAKAEGRS